MLTESIYNVGVRGEIEVKAFRGSRRSSVYRDLTLRATDAARLAEAALHTDDGRGLLALLAEDGPAELDKLDARRLADETSTVRMSGTLPDLDADLTALAELARWCSRATDEGHVTIRRLAA